MPKVTVELDEESIAAARDAGIDLSELLLRACIAYRRTFMPLRAARPL